MDPESIPTQIPKSPQPPLLPIFIVLLVLLFSSTAILFYQNTQLQKQVAVLQTTPTPQKSLNSQTPDPTISPKFSQSYSDKEFTLNFPDECVQGKEYIECKNDKFNISIDTKVDGVGTSGRDDIKIISLNGIKWKRFTINANPEKPTPVFSAYDNNLDIKNNTYFIGVYYTSFSIEAQNYFEQILSTFTFVNNASSPSIKQSNQIKILNFSIPKGWKTVQDSTNSLSLSYDSNTSSPDVTTNTNGISLLRRRKDTALGDYYCETVNLFPYDGGSRHQFLYEHLGQTPTKSNLWPDYKETEYSYNEKSCLVLNGISISQMNTVWGMCNVGNNKAILFTSCDRDGANYEKVMQTIQILK